MRYVKRLSFSRADVVKKVHSVCYHVPDEVDRISPHSCTECGGFGKDHKRYVTWEYGTSNDGLISRTSWDGRGFCSWTCRCNYFGIDGRKSR